MNTPTTPTAAVIGWPIAHSRSPIIHNYWLKKYQLPGTYAKLPVPPEELANFVGRLKKPPYLGCNVTLPHKEAILALVDGYDDRVARTGSANTLYKENGSLLATSTDGPGFFANLKSSQPNYDPSGKPIVVLGAGGSAKAIVDELLRRGADRIEVFNRTQSRAEAIVQRFGKQVTAVQANDFHASLSGAGLIINTTSAGLANSDLLHIPMELLPQDCVVADIVYTPLITPFLQQAQARQLATVGGLGMLLHQAVVGFEKWFGVLPTVDEELYDLVAADIQAGLGQ